MSSPLLPLSALLVPSGCTPTDAVPTDAVATDEAVLRTSPTLDATTLVVADGTPGTIPDLRRVAPVYASDEFGTTDPAGTQLVTSWAQFDALLRRYRTIGVLGLLVHDINKRLMIGQDGRTLLQLKEALVQPGMPAITSIVLDGCGAGLEVDAMLVMAQALQLSTLTAWPLLVGFAPVTITGWTEADVERELAASEAHILGPRSAADAVHQGLLVYTWLQTGNRDPAAFPGPGSFAPGSTEDRAARRADLGYLSRARAATYSISRSTEPGRGTAAGYRIALEGAYVRTANRSPGSGTDPYRELYLVSVSPP